MAVSMFDQLFGQLLFTNKEKHVYSLRILECVCVCVIGVNVQFHFDNEIYIYI